MMKSLYHLLSIIRFQVSIQTFMVFIDQHTHNGKLPYSYHKAFSLVRPLKVYLIYITFGAV